MLRYKRTLAASLLMAFISASAMGGGLIGIVYVLREILGKDAITLQERAREAAAGLPVAIPESWIASVPTDRFDAVVALVIVLSILTVFGAAANFCHMYLANTVTVRTVATVRRDAFRQAIHLPMEAVVGKSSDILSRILSDTNGLMTGFQTLTGKTVARLTKGAAALAVAIYFEPRLTLVALLVLPIVFTIVRKLGKQIRRAARGAMRAQAKLLQAGNESLQSLRVIKTHSSERYELGRFSQHNRAMMREQLRARTAKALADPLTQSVMLFVVGGLAIIAAKFIIDGRIELTNFMGALMGLAVAGDTLKPLTKVAQEIQASEAAAVRVDEVIGAEPEPFHLFIDHARKRRKIGRHHESIEFRDVSFRYPEAESPAIRDVNLRIEHGETIAFVGPNGCGKTTLLSLVPRLFSPTSGTISIDGCDISDVHLRSLRRQIGVVTQEVVLFDGTIASNIAYAAPAATREDIREAARKAGALRFIEEKPDGFDEHVGEQGLTLSGGQRQRIAIARAILRDPAILILDEATSMIDAESERAIGEALKQFAEGRTCLVVAHRLNTVERADRIVVMDEGRIVDIGAHAELLERCALYQSLTNTQLRRSLEGAADEGLARDGAVVVEAQQSVPKRPSATTSATPESAE